MGTGSFDLDMSVRAITSTVIGLTVAFAVVGAIGVCEDAFGHSGEVGAPPPPDPPPVPVGRPGPVPGGSPGVGDGGTGGPTYGGGGTRGPATGPGKGPTGRPPRTAGGTRPPQRFDPNRKGPPTASGPSPDHWSFWWFVNRRRYLDATGPQAAQTPSGNGSGRSTRAPEDALWRAEAQQALTAALSDPDEEIAASAAVALGKTGDLSLTPVLTAIVKNRDRRQTEREAAAIGLGLLGTARTGTALPGPTLTGTATAARAALMAVARNDKEPTRLRATAIHSLGMRGAPESLPFLMEFAFSQEPEWDVPTTASVALAALGDDLVRTDLERLLSGGRRSQRMRRVYAAQALALSGDAASIPALVKSARDDDPHVRKAVYLALGEIAADDDEAMEILVRAVHRERNSGAKNAAVIALGSSGHRKADSALRHAYEKGDSLHQQYAALALGLLARKRDDPSIVADLEVDLKERANADLRGALAIALGLARRQASADLLIEIAKDRGDPSLRAKAALAVGMTGARARAADLAAIVSSERDANLRAEAAYGLGLLGDRSAVAFLSTRIKDTSSVYVQGSSAVALGRIGGADAARALTAMLADESNAEVSRAAAAISLGLLLGPEGGRRIARVGRNLDWTSLTPTVYEIVQIQ